VQSGFNGAGTTIGIIIDTAPSANDLNAYLTAFQIPSTSRTVTQEVVPINGGTGSVGSDSAFEAALDEETVAGLAPGANVIIYEIPDLSEGSIIDAIEAVESDAKATVVSMSFGGCEDGYGAQNFASGVSAGITFVASSGDYGNECPTGPSSYTPGLNYPASDPNVVGVGGNESVSTIAKTVAWNDNYGATGGGVSAVFTTLPTFQNGVSGLSSASARNVPDVALPSVNVAACQSGCGGGYGTSFSSPEVAAMIAEISQYCGGLQFGNANSTLFYPAFAAASSNFIDVLSGNNQFGNSTPYFTAGSGYDNTTGLGMPNGMAIAKAACGTIPSGGRARVAASRSFRRGTSTVAIPIDHPTDRAYAAHAQPVALRSAADLGERTSTTTMPIHVILTQTAARMGGDANVAAILRANGFTVTKTFRDHVVVDAQGTTAQVERLFATAIHNYAQGQYGTRFAPAASITVPADLARFVSSVVLDNAVTHFAPHHGGLASSGFHF
jgi:subtilase family serine protease